MKRSQCLNALTTNNEEVTIAAEEMCVMSLQCVINRWDDGSDI